MEPTAGVTRVVNSMVTYGPNGGHCSAGVTPHHPVMGGIGASVLGCVMGDIVIDDILLDEHPLFTHNPVRPLCHHCVVGLAPCKQQGSTESQNLAAQHRGEDPMHGSRVHARLTGILHTRT